MNISDDIIYKPMQSWKFKKKCSRNQKIVQMVQKKKIYINNSYNNTMGMVMLAEFLSLS